MRDQQCGTSVGIDSSSDSFGEGGSMETLMKSDAYPKQCPTPMTTSLDWANVMGSENVAVIGGSCEASSNGVANGNTPRRMPPSNVAGYLPFRMLAGETARVYAIYADKVVVATNYRLIVVVDRGKEVALNIPLLCIECVEIRELFLLFVNCRDGNVARISFDNNEACTEWSKCLAQMAGLSSVKRNVFAFAFHAWMMDEKEKGQTRIFQEINVNSSAVVYAEFKRLGFSSEYWKITDINDKFKLCSSYPKLWITVKCMTDEQLEKTATFRSSSRVPAVVWRDVISGAVLVRSSQPSPGITMWRCDEDELMLNSVVQACNQATEKDVKLLIVDARSYAAAFANRARGGGYELPEYYGNCEVAYMGLPNVHAVRKSFTALRTLCSNYYQDPKLWHSGLESTGWVQNLSSLISVSILVARALRVERRPVLVHCTDGWDRTTQIVALAKLLLDSHYRTITGFMELIEREWVEFGHKFSDRNGISPTDASERSPIFLQWLDAVHQLLKQFPTAFEFNEVYLLKLAQHSYSGLFGTFLYNSLAERINHSAASQTFSVWAYLNNTPTASGDCRNALFDPGRWVDPDRVLWPQCDIMHLYLWSKLYNHCPAPPCSSSVYNNNNNNSSNGTGGDICFGVGGELRYRIASGSHSVSSVHNSPIKLVNGACSAGVKDGSKLVASRCVNGAMLVAGKPDGHAAVMRKSNDSNDFDEERIAESVASATANLSGLVFNGERRRLDSLTRAKSVDNFTSVDSWVAATAVAGDVEGDNSLQPTSRAITENGYPVPTEDSGGAAIHAGISRVCSDPSFDVSFLDASQSPPLCDAVLPLNAGIGNESDVLGNGYSGNVDNKIAEVATNNVNRNCVVDNSDSLFCDNQLGENNVNNCCEQNAGGDNLECDGTKCIGRGLSNEARISNNVAGFQINHTMPFLENGAKNSSAPHRTDQPPPTDPVDVLLRHAAGFYEGGSISSSYGSSPLASSTPLDDNNLFAIIGSKDKNNFHIDSPLPPCQLSDGKNCNSLCSRQDIVGTDVPDSGPSAAGRHLTSNDQPPLAFVDDFYVRTSDNKNRNCNCTRGDSPRGCVITTCVAHKPPTSTGSQTRIAEHNSAYLPPNQGPSCHNGLKPSYLNNNNNNSSSCSCNNNNNNNNNNDNCCSCNSSGSCTSTMDLSCASVPSSREVRIPAENGLVLPPSRNSVLEVASADGIEMSTSTSDISDSNARSHFLASIMTAQKLTPRHQRQHYRALDSLSGKHQYEQQLFHYDSESEHFRMNMASHGKYSAPVRCLMDPDGLLRIKDVVQDRVKEIESSYQFQIRHLEMEVRRLKIQAERRGKLCVCGGEVPNGVAIGGKVVNGHEAHHPEPAGGAGAGGPRSLESTTGSDVSWEAVDEGDGNPTLWVPDHIVSKCMGCDRTFWMASRKHHCRSCGKVFCGTCSNFECAVPSEQLYEPVRVCSVCYQHLEVLQYAQRGSKIQA